MYNCSVCKTAVGPKIPMKRFIQYRPNGQIAKESPVCYPCNKALDAGIPLRSLLRKHGHNIPITREEEKRAFELWYNSENDRNGESEHATLIPSKNGVDNKKPTPVRCNAVLCDVCGEDASEGQVTAETTLCPKHCEKARGRKGRLGSR